MVPVDSAHVGLTAQAPSRGVPAPLQPQLLTQGISYLIQVEDGSLTAGRERDSLGRRTSSKGGFSLLSAGIEMWGDPSESSGKSC